MQKGTAEEARERSDVLASSGTDCRRRLRTGARASGQVSNAMASRLDGRFRGPGQTGRRADGQRAGGQRAAGCTHSWSCGRCTERWTAPSLRASLACVRFCNQRCCGWPAAALNGPVWGRQARLCSSRRTGKLSPGAGVIGRGGAVGIRGSLGARTSPRLSLSSWCGGMDGEGCERRTGGGGSEQEALYGARRARAVRVEKCCAATLGVRGVRSPVVSRSPSAGTRNPSSQVA